MRDLADAGRAVVDSPPAGPAPIEQIESRARGRRRRGHARAAAALVTAAALIAGAVVIAHNRTTSSPVANGTHTTPKPQPPVPNTGKARVDLRLRAHLGIGAPKGWVPVDYGDARLWIPPTWKVTPGGCPGAAAGWVELGGPYKEICGVSSATEYVRLTRLVDVATAGRKRFINSYPVYSEAGSGLPDQWSVPALNVSITARGASAERVLETLAPSARVIASQYPPDSVPSDWHRVSYGGLSIAAPKAWPTHLIANASTCQRFTSATVLAGQPAPVPCPPPQPVAPVPQDGVWIGAFSNADPSTPGREVPVLAGSGLHARAAGADLVHPSSILDVVVTVDQHWQVIQIGLGRDGRIANAILHSIRVAPTTGYSVG